MLNISNPFQNQSSSNTTEVQNRGKISHFLMLVKFSIEVGVRIMFGKTITDDVVDISQLACNTRTTHVPLRNLVLLLCNTISSIFFTVLSKSVCDFFK